MTADTEPTTDDLHSDQHVRSIGLPADDLPGRAEWTDAHNGAPTEAELDAWFIAKMQQHDSASARIASGNISIIDAIAATLGGVA